MTDILGEYFNLLSQNLLTTLDTPDAYLNKIALSTITIIIGILIHILFKAIINRNIKKFTRKIRIKKAFKSIIITVIIVIILFIWIQAINSLVLIALVIGAFAIVMLRGLTHNIIGYFVIKYRTYFKIGNRVEFNGIIGDVIDINLISFKLLEVRNLLNSDTETGRVIQVPNSIIFEDSIKIVGDESIYIWQEFHYTLSFDSNWKQAESIMTDVGDSYYKEYILHDIKENNKYLVGEQEGSEPVFSLNTNDIGIIVNLRYLTDYRKGTSVKTKLQREILNKFEKSSDIKFAVSDIRILSK